MVPSSSYTPAAATATGSATSSPLFQSRKMLLSNTNQSSSKQPRLMDICFIPHSISEQWVLVQTVDELSLIIEEISAIYSALMPDVRANAKHGISTVIRQLLVNMSCEAFQVVINGLKLMELMVDDHAECFLPELDALLPKLIQYLDDERVILRHHVLRLAYSLAARLDFQVVHNFIELVIGQGSRSKSGRMEYCLKLAAIALMRYCQTTDYDTINTSSTYAAVPTSLQLTIARIASRVVPILTSSHESNNVSSWSEISKNLVIDIVSASYAILNHVCNHSNGSDISGSSHASSSSSSSNLTTSVLSLDFIKMLQLDEHITIDCQIQKLIVQRSQEDLFAAIRKDITIQLVVRHILTLKKKISVVSTGNTTTAIATTIVCIDDVAAVTDNNSISGNNNSNDSNSNSSNNDSNSNGSNNDSHSNSCNNDSNSKDDNGAHLQQSSVSVNDDSSKSRSNSDGNDGSSSMSLDVVQEVAPSNKSDSAYPSTGAALYSPLPFSLVRHKPVVLDMLAKEEKSSSLSAVYSYDSDSYLNFRNKSPTATSSSRYPMPSSWDMDALDSDMTDTVIAMKEMRTLDASWDYSTMKVPTDIHDGDEAEEIDNEAIIDKSKLKTLKRTGRKSVSRRVHSATDGTVPDEELRHWMLDRTPNTSDGVRTLIQKKMASDDDMVDAKTQDDGRQVASINKLFTSFNTTPNYMEETEKVNRMRDAFMTRVKIQLIDKSTSNAATATSKDSKRMAKSKGRKDESLNSSKEDSSKGSSKQHLPSTSPIKQSMTSPRVSDYSPGRNKAASVEVADASPLSPPNTNTSMNKSSDFDYLTTAEIMPSTNPTKEFNRALLNLETQDWPDIFHTLNSIRKIALHHQNVLLSSGNLHSIVLGVCRQIDNLRSAVSKNAILTIGDLFEGLGVAMDSEVLGTVPCLYKRCGDSSNFLGESADNAIVQIIENVNPSRCLNALLTGIDHKNSSIRGKALHFIACLLERRTNDIRNSRELDALRSKLSKALGDSSSEARANSRRVVRLLLEHTLCTRSELDQFIPNDLLNKIMQVNNSNTHTTPLKKRQSREKMSSHSSYNNNDSVLSSSGGGSAVSASLNLYDDSENDEVKTAGAHTVSRSPKQAKGASGSNTPSRAKAAAAKKEMDNSPEMQKLPDVLKALSSQNWIERKNALATLTEVLLLHSTVLRNAGKLDGILERILDKLDDGSVKIQLFALECLQKIHDKVPMLLPSNQLVVVPLLLNTSSLANKQVSGIGLDFTMKVLLSISPHQLFPQLCTIALHDKERVRSMSFRAVTYLIIHYAESPAWIELINPIMKKHVFSAVCQALFGVGVKAEIRVAASETLKCLSKMLIAYGSVDSNPNIWQWVDDHSKQDEIKRLIIV